MVHLYTSFYEWTLLHMEKLIHYKEGFVDHIHKADSQISLAHAHCTYSPKFLKHQLMM